MPYSEKINETSINSIQITNTVILHSNQEMSLGAASKRLIERCW